MEDGFAIFAEAAVAARRAGARRSVVVAAEVDCLEAGPVSAPAPTRVADPPSEGAENE